MNAVDSDRQKQGILRRSRMSCDRLLEAFENYMKDPQQNSTTAKSVYASYAASIDRIGLQAGETAQRLGTTLDAKELVTEYKGRLSRLFEKYS